jgi:hypothetical protein
VGGLAAALVAALIVPFGCTFLVESEGLSDQWGSSDVEAADTSIEPDTHPAGETGESDADATAIDTRPPDPPDADCDAASDGGHTYLACRSFGNWNRARTTCASFAGYHLVAIDDAAEQDFVDKLLAGRGAAWIGLADDLSEGNYRWANGTTLGSYENWAPDEPHGESRPWEDCVVMQANGFWYDEDCANNYNFILCESQ